MAGQVKPLEREKNDNLWQWYLEYKIPTAIEKNIQLRKDEKQSIIDARLSVNNYKTHLRNLEQEIKKDFENITVDEIQNVNQKSKSFIAGFYIDCIANRKMKPCTDVILSLIPQEYKTLVQVILD